MNVPPTPNLENLKLHGQKTKKKPILRNQNIPHSPIRPKQHPTINTPAIYTNKSPKVSNTPQALCCIYHHDKKAQYFNQNNPKQRYCVQCAAVQQFNQKRADHCSIYTYESQKQDNNKRIVHYDKERVYKEEAIAEFMQSVKDLKQNLTIIKNNSVEHLKEQQAKFSQNFQYINESFENLIMEIEQKRKELTSNLITLIEKKKESVNQTIIMFNNIKDSLERYVFDINKHYDEILGELEINKFQQIIEQYHAKVDYYSESAGVNKHLNKKIPAYEDISVYLPIREIHNAIEKANVKSYHKQSMLIHNRDDRAKGNASNRCQNNNREIKSSNIIKPQAQHRKIIKQSKNRKVHVGFKDYDSQKIIGDATRIYMHH